jgi:nucleotide-binding universal stress UspA family protein
VRSRLGATDVSDYHQDEARKVLDPAMANLAAHGLKAEAISKVGPAGETIADFAQQGAYDMVIMGTHGHGALGRLVMGSVSTNVLANCTVPVLLVR